MKKDIFISYRNDGIGNNFATRITNDLKQQGYSVYFNPNEATLTEKRYAASRPKIVKLQMKIDSNHDKNKGGTVTTNSFTKVIFL